jgi:hypothetical protein
VPGLVDREVPAAAELGFGGAEHDRPGLGADAAVDVLATPVDLVLKRNVDIADRDLGVGQETERVVVVGPRDTAHVPPQVPISQRAATAAEHVRPEPLTEMFRPLTEKLLGKEDGSGENHRQNGGESPLSRHVSALVLGFRGFPVYQPVRPAVDRPIPSSPECRSL